MSDPAPTVRAVDDCTLLPDIPRPLPRYQVTVTLPRAAGNDALLPPGAQAVVELAAVAVAAEGLLTAWMFRRPCSR